MGSIYLQTISSVSQRALGCVWPCVIISTSFVYAFVLVVISRQIVEIVDTYASLSNASNYNSRQKNPAK